MGKLVRKSRGGFENYKLVSELNFSGILKQKSVFFQYQFNLQNINLFTSLNLSFPSLHPQICLLLILLSLIFNLLICFILKKRIICKLCNNTPHNNILLTFLYLPIQSSSFMQTRQPDEQPLAVSYKTQNHSTRIQPNIQTLEMEVPQLIPKGFLSKSSQSHLENLIEIKQMSIQQLQAENNKLKNSIREMQRKLEEFERRLDENLKRHKQEYAKSKIGQEIVESMELKNAYKMCDIYKKQIAQLKRKQALNKENKIQELSNTIIQLEKDKEKLLGEIKDLKKLSRQQEKALKEMIGPNVLKLMSENDQLRQQIRRLEEKEYNSQSNSKFSTYDRKNNKTELNTNQLFKIFKQEEQNTEATQIQNLKNRLLKDNRKISILMNENSKLREYVQELRAQLIEKDKDFSQLRERFINFNKRQARQREASMKRKRMVTQPQISNKKEKRNEADIYRSRREKTELSHRKLQSQLHTVQISEKIIKHKSRKQTKNIRITSLEKYPKMLVVGEKDQQNYRWNHLNLSSKIKEVQVSAHSEGHILQVNFRYQKGEPKNGLKSPYASFCCEQNSDEYIICVKGGFKTGLLRYLTMETNKGRKSNFCQADLKNECINFQFRSHQNEYLGGFFGQNSSEGVTRLGCYVEQEK